MDVNLSLYKSAFEFLEVAGPFLYTKETVNNLILGVSERLVKDPEAFKNPFFATVTDESGQIVLAAVMTPPHNLILAGGDQFDVGISVLIAHLQAEQIAIPGVIGPVEIADHFVQTWKGLQLENSTVGMNQRVYELRRVRMPEQVPGEFWGAREEDVPTVAVWLQAFEEEAIGKCNDLDLERAERLVENDNVFVWLNKGQPRAMAIKLRPIAHSVTIGGVYTPPEYRRQGYATALVAHLSQHLLDQGYQFVNLFTDLSNPTSNSIYKKIGFHPVCDFRMYEITGSLADPDGLS